MLQWVHHLESQSLVIGSWGQQNHTPLETEQGIIERVHEFKLLGATLTWTTH